MKLGQKPGELDILVTKKQVYCMETVKFWKLKDLKQLFQLL